jgi:hypothetical protein
LPDGGVDEPASLEGCFSDRFFFDRFFLAMGLTPPWLSGRFYFSGVKPGIGYATIMTVNGQPIFAIRDYPDDCRCE